MLQQSAISRQELEQIISDFMLELGIPAHLRGYQFLRSAVEMCVGDMELVGSVTKLLYPDLAKMYQTTDRRLREPSAMRSRCPGREGTVSCLRNFLDTVTARNTTGRLTVSISRQ